MGHLKQTFASGLVVVLPVLLTVLLVIWLYSLVARFPLLYVIDSPVVRVLATIVATAVTLYAAGRFSRSLFGRVLTSILDAGFDRVPGARVIYNGSKQTLQTSVENSEGIRPVKVNTWDDVHMTAFVIHPEPVDGQIEVLIPMAPPFAATAFVTSVDEEQIIETDESFDRALTRVISGGFA